MGYKWVVRGKKRLRQQKEGGEKKMKRNNKIKKGTEEYSVVSDEPEL